MGFMFDIIRLVLMAALFVSIMSVVWVLLSLMWSIVVFRVMVMFFLIISFSKASTNVSVLPFVNQMLWVCFRWLIIL